MAIVENPGVGSDWWQYSDSHCGYARSDCRDDLKTTFTALTDITIFWKTEPTLNKPISISKTDTDPALMHSWSRDFHGGFLK